MLLDLTELEGRGLQIDQSVEVPDFSWNGGTVSCGRAQLSGRLQRTRRGIELAGWFSTVAAVWCGRCLAPVELPVRESFRLFLVPGGEAGEAYAPIPEDDPDAVDLYPLEGATVDLGAVVREQVDLALPYRVLCRDVDRECEHIDPALGADEPRGVDERWSELERLRERIRGRRENEE
jgi:uncharacterized metal-binding protein YceD (DUF177 family)